MYIINIYTTIELLIDRDRDINEKYYLIDFDRERKQRYDIISLHDLLSIPLYSTLLAVPLISRKKMRFYATLFFTSLIFAPQTCCNNPQLSVASYQRRTYLNVFVLQKAWKNLAASGKFHGSRETKFRYRLPR